VSLAPSIISLDQIELREANALLVLWDHQMGACNRPNGDTRAHGLFLHGKLVSVAITASLIAETCAGFNRSEAMELARLCACRPDINRVMLRLWRISVFPAFGRDWAVSYQDEALHTGNTYRLDGWIRLARSRSGTDQRSGRKGRSKTIWGWNSDRVAREHRLNRIEEAST
jgi:hypothetical protein